MKISLIKLRAMIKYFSDNTDKNNLGKVKLMKLFYFVDFTHTREYGQPVTFDNYIKLEHGPIPSTIKNLVDEVSDSPDIAVLADIIEIKKVEGRYIHKIVNLKNFTQEDQKMFSQSELKTLEEVCKRFYSSNSKTIEDASHEDGPWGQVSFLGDIPYELAFDEDDEESQTKREMVNFLVSTIN